MKLPEEQVKRFWKDGFLIVENLLDENEVVRLREHAEWVASGEAPHIPGQQLQVEPRVLQGKDQAETYGDSLRKMSHLAFYDETFEAHARNPKILDIIESLLGPDIKLYQDQLFMKPPRIGSRQRYHQDMPLGFHIDPPDMVTCWAALSDSTIENGCVWMLPGTHQFGIIERSKWETYEQMSLESRLPEEQPVELKAGSCSFHHGLILHSSRPNLTEKRRRGYATHYVSAKCHYTASPEKNDAMLVRGRSIPGCI
ncbi:MAG: phytanoyl-CoA dioxygenase family protein [Candidatus Poribacteria bacterium]|nr:phytanoyl-CoA dioxygenase family protein [Candidatus Poribacteria bacterium]